MRYALVLFFFFFFIQLQKQTERQATRPAILLTDEKLLRGKLLFSKYIPRADHLLYDTNLSS